MEDQSYLGIGYNYGSFNNENLPRGTSGTIATAGTDASSAVAPTRTSSNAGMNVDDLMQSYMQQCVDYHEHEQQKQQHQVTGMVASAPALASASSSAISSTRTCTSTSPSLPLSLVQTIQPMKFIPATKPPSAMDTARANANSNSNASANIKSTAVIASDTKSPMSQTPEFTAALERAKAIAQRLANGTSALTLTASASSSSITSSGYPYAQKRWEFLQTHQQKLHTRWIENLQYLAQKDEEQLERMKNQIADVNDALYGRGRGRDSQQQQQQRKRPRGDGVVQSMAGIGSKERHHVQKQVGRRVSSLPPCGIYITGLLFKDDDDNMNSSSMTMTMEETLTQLFSSYGKVSSVKLYTDRKTGRKKGDGLILYDWGSIRKKRITTLTGGGGGDLVAASAALDADDVKEFQNMVCSQLNGVELPCGIVMNAEPMDTEYKHSHKKQKENEPTTKQRIDSGDHNESSAAGEAGTVISDHNVGESGKENTSGDDEDLDDFFASLE